MIEDNLLDARLLRETLQIEEDFPVTFHHATSFSEGIKFLTRETADIILLDLSLPDGEGFEMVETLRTQHPHIPVIVLTGTDNDQVATYAVRQGAQDYLVKGKVDRSLLIRSIRYAVERQRMISDIIKHKKDKDQIQASLNEKDVLLKEIHHRVKNNLQIILSLLKLQSGSLKESRDMEFFKDCRNKIRAMALIHEILYNSESLAKINFSDYVRKLALGLFQSYGVDESSIALEIKADDILLSLDGAIPCGLIINELVSNSLKHAFPKKKKGKIWISFKSNAPFKTVTLAVGDDGVSLPGDWDKRKSESLGLRLVSTLTEQLQGTMEVHHNGGTEFRVQFPSGG